MKLNADLGERVNGKLLGMDAELMPLLDQANIACGAHAGDEETMRETVHLAKQHSVEIGAHPSYPDRENFGRVSMDLQLMDLVTEIFNQILILDRIADEESHPITYVKPHGALYNDMMANPSMLKLVMNTIAAYPKQLKLMLLSSSNHKEHQQLAEKAGIELIFEAFADRAYSDSGALVSRTHSNAVHTENGAIDQVNSLLNAGLIKSENGHDLSFPVDSICVHGDNPEALAMVEKIRGLLNAKLAI